MYIEIYICTYIYKCIYRYSTYIYKCIYRYIYVKIYINTYTDREWSHRRSVENDDNCSSYCDVIVCVRAYICTHKRIHQQTEMHMQIYINIHT